jgi:hypothetical protein
LDNIEPMANSEVELRISVRASPETGDHEVCLHGDDENLIDLFGDPAMGLDPADLLVSPCPLVAGQAARSVLIARCPSGIMGRSDVHVNVIREANIVTWSDPRAPEIQRRFHAPAYHAEITRALGDHSWETPERTAARLLAELVDRRALARLGLSFMWASGRADPDVFTVALWLEPGPYQVLVRVPLDNLAPAALAQSAATLLSTPAATWDVEWLAQSPGMPSPSIAGPGWQRDKYSAI